MSLLKIILETAWLEMKIGATKLKENAGDEALMHAESSWRLKKNSVAAKLAFMACILSGKFNEASSWYDRALSVNNG